MDGCDSGALIWEVASGWGGIWPDQFVLVFHCRGAWLMVVQAGSTLGSLDTWAYLCQGSVHEKDAHHADACIPLRIALTSGAISRCIFSLVLFLFLIRMDRQTCVI